MQVDFSIKKLDNYFKINSTLHKTVALELYISYES